VGQLALLSLVAPQLIFQQAISKSEAFIQRNHKRKHRENTMTKFFQILAKLQKNSSKCLNSWCLHTSMDTHGLKTCFVFLESYSPSSSSCSFPYPILVPRETALVLHDSTFWPQVVGQDVDIFLNLSQTEILAWEFYK
jgi:hypothetical protein